jgi:hypothetical protein
VGDSKADCSRVPGVRLRPSETSVTTSVVRRGSTADRSIRIGVTLVHETGAAVPLGLSLPPGVAVPLGEAVPPGVSEGLAVRSGLGEPVPVAVAVGFVGIIGGSTRPQPARASVAVAVAASRAIEPGTRAAGRRRLVRRRSGAVGILRSLRPGSQTL